MKTIITARKLCKKYGTFKAVDRISFDIQEGECFGFLGPNGAGKTSTVRMIHCVSPVTSGTLTVQGMAAHVDNRAIKQQTGVIPQEITLDNDLTVRENLQVFAHFFDIAAPRPAKRIAELLKFVELEKKRDSRIDQLSTGMKRRLLIARALLNQPQIIIADEPTTGLDPQARHLIWQRLRQLKSQGVTLILTTQYMEEAQQLCDRIVIMHQGRILKEGVPAAAHRGGDRPRSGRDPRRPRPGRKAAGRARPAGPRPRARRRHAVFLLPRRPAADEKSARARPARHRAPAGLAGGRLPEADRQEPDRMNFSYRIVYVFWRNMISYKRFVLTTFIASLIQPLFYLITFGIGMGAYIGKFGGKPYLYFLVPGVLITSVMMTASFECMYGTFVKMVHEKLYDSLIATPVSAEDAVAGDIAWAAFRGLVSGGLMMIVAIFMGILPVSLVSVLLLILLMIFVGILFGSLAMIVTSVRPQLRLLQLLFGAGDHAHALFLRRLLPPGQVPRLDEDAVAVHAPDPRRGHLPGHLLGDYTRGLIFNFLVIFVLEVVAFLIGVRLMKKRLIK